MFTNPHDQKDDRQQWQDDADAWRDRHAGPPQGFAGELFRLGVDLSRVQAEEVGQIVPANTPVHA